MSNGSWFDLGSDKQNGSKPFSFSSLFVLGSYVLLFGRHLSSFLWIQFSGSNMPFFLLSIHNLCLDPCLCAADCYDPLDPNGNVTITYDIRTWTTHGYVVSLTFVLSLQSVFKTRLLGRSFHTLIKNA